MRLHHLVTFTLGVAVLAAACQAAPATSAPETPTPDPGAAGACPVAPEPGNVAGWGSEGQRPSLIPVIASSRIACGEERILVSFLDRTNRPAATPDRTLTVRFYNLARDPSTPVTEAEGRFIWGIEGQRGLYALQANLPEAGMWGAEFVTAAPGSPEETIRVQFQVHREVPTVRVGDLAPASETQTLADVGGDITLISTDRDPIPALYETSVDDALAAGEPFVLIFATPKFCATAQCGPTLDRLKPLVDAYPTITFINVEPYLLEPVDGQLQPALSASGQLQVVPAVEEWGLLSEPWIFVVDGDGIVRASFEGVVSDEEMAAALDAVR
jgi:hypothetical protein